MEDNIRELLNSEISEEIENLKTLDPGSKEHSAAVESLEKLYKLRIEENKAQTEEKESEIKHSEESENRYLRFTAEAAGIILPLMFYAFWMKKGLKFEETGTFTSATFRGLINRFRPTK